MRQEEFYWNTIQKLQNATTKASRDNITRETGISRMPLLAASPAFLHPSFFPLDPFHLFYENCMAFIWDLWMTKSKPSEVIHVNAEKGRKFGQLVVEAMLTLPASFCGAVRDPFLKHQSQYKIYEWMTLLHWYIIPIGIELQFNSTVLENFSHFSNAVEMAMTIKARSEKELVELYNLIKMFLEGFERIYVGEDPEMVSRCRLCIFQLIHVPIHIEWNGSIRVGSQATVERAIGGVGQKIRSKKAPFANLANILYEKELIKLLLLYYPTLEAPSASKSISKITPLQEIKILKKEQNSSQEFLKQLHAICVWLQKDFNPYLKLHRWGKIFLPGGTVLHSKIGECQKNIPSRSARYFESQINDTMQPIFGESLAFYEEAETHQLLVVYRPLRNTQQVLQRWRGYWSENIAVLPVSAISDKIGIWSISKWVYMLRKHPGLALLNPEESGQSETDGEE
jgi:hypothetical protein